MDEASKIIQLIEHVGDRIDIDESNLTPIQEFYKDAKIFVTGGTGFLGQILTEKLLRSCPVSTIYLLIRNKKGKGVDTRLKEIFDDQLFNRMKKACPDFQQKVVAVEGDCALPDLGLSDQDKTLLRNEVDIVFHVAATVRFDETLKIAAAINIRAIRDLSRLAQQMPKLKSLVQVSTVFSNCIQDVIEEKVYLTPTDYNQLLLLTDSLDDALLEELRPHLIGKCPNTYIYTKQLAEGVVKGETRGLAAGIYRPAIVASTLREPIRGWINNLYGAAGVTVGVGLGLIRVININGNNNANIIPVDMCINGLIASAWDVAKRFKDAKDANEEFQTPVYNCESATHKPITWKYFNAVVTKSADLVACTMSVWPENIYFIPSYKLYYVLSLLLHIVPAALVDTVLLCMGKKRRYLDKNLVGMLKVYKKVHHFMSVLSYFGLMSFKYSSRNIQKMLTSMTERDRRMFFCDIKELDWEEFFMTYALGCRIYICKDPISTIPEGKKRRTRLIWAQRTLKAVLVLLAISILYYTVSTISQVIYA